MRLRLNSSDSLIGELMVGDAVGEVIESRAEGFSTGDIAMGNIGWQVIGIAGTNQKDRIYITNELGFDHGLNYKIDNIPARLEALCPNGVDFYWDNVGGDLADNIIEKIATGGRVVICGQITQYNTTSSPRGLRTANILLSRQARMEGFWVGHPRP